VGARDRGVGGRAPGSDLRHALDVRVNALAAGIDPFELAKVMGTSIEMIERHYGTLIGGAMAGIASRLATFEAEQDRATRDVGTL
jgi:hypothetical protein